MKTLYIMRHAKSSWELDLADHDRPLNDRGNTDAHLVGKALKSKIKPVDRYICSTANRAYTTAKIVLSCLDVDEEKLTKEPKLYDFEGHQVIDIIKGTDDDVDTLMIFGHNYAFTSIVNLYGGIRLDNLPTAGLVAITFDTDHWNQIDIGKTILTIFPKSLK